LSQASQTGAARDALSAAREAFSGLGMAAWMETSGRLAL
jgi:hypothetical protein